MYNAQEDFTSRELTTFSTAFLDCALWSSTDDHGASLERYHISNIDLITRDQLMLECRDFYHANYDDLCAHGSMEQGGQDFWLTRNGHGAGFWDRGTGDVGQRLTAAAKVWGSVELYVGSDGSIYAYGYEQLPLL